MIDVINMKVGSFDLDHIDISWEISATNEDLTLYDFYLLRSIDGQEGPFHQIAGPFLNSFMFRDPDVHRLYRWREYYYKIRVVRRDDGKEFTTKAEWIRAKPDLIALEVQRRNYLLFKEYAGRKCILYPSLTFGQICPVCMDVGPKGNSIGRETVSNCKTCFDTGWVGGYATPVVIYGQVDPSAHAVQHTGTMEMAPDRTSAKFGPYPYMHPKDIIIDPENVRWRVDTVSFTKKNGAILHQIPTLSRIPDGSVVYSLPAEIDNGSPEREFTRPMTLDSDYSYTGD